jgi:hypothetical protein
VCLFRVSASHQAGTIHRLEFRYIEFWQTDYLESGSFRIHPTNFSTARLQTCNLSRRIRELFAPSLRPPRSADNRNCRFDRLLTVRGYVQGKTDEAGNRNNHIPTIKQTSIK